MPVNFGAQVKAPPVKRGSARSTATQVEIPRTQRELREEGLNGLAQIGQGIALGFKQYADAATLGTHFPPLATELAKLADHYDVIAKPIDLLIQVGPFGALIASAMPLVAQLAVNHRMAPAGVMGTVPPETLSAQMQAQMMRMQAAMMRQQAEAMADMEKARAEMQELMNTSHRTGEPYDSPAV